MFKERGESLIILGIVSLVAIIGLIFIFSEGKTTGEVMRGRPFGGEEKVYAVEDGAIFESTHLFQPTQGIVMRRIPPTEPASLPTLRKTPRTWEPTLRRRYTTAYPAGRRTWGIQAFEHAFIQLYRQYPEVEKYAVCFASFGFQSRTNCWITTRAEYEAFLNGRIQERDFTS